MKQHLDAKFRHDLTTETHVSPRLDAPASWRVSAFSSLVSRRKNLAGMHPPYSDHQHCLADRLDHPSAGLREPFFDRHMVGPRKSRADDRGENSLSPIYSSSEQ
jgi:hypothetical protein